MYRVMIISFFITVFLVGCVKLYFDSPTSSTHETINTLNKAKHLDENSEIDNDE